MTTHIPIKIAYETLWRQTRRGKKNVWAQLVVRITTEMPTEKAAVILVINLGKTTT